MKTIPTKRIIILIACLFLCILLLLFFGNSKVDDLNTAANNTKINKVKNNKTEVTDVLDKKVDVKLKYDYTNTDLFLKGINIDDKNTVKEEQTIDNKKYTKYSFTVKAATLNEILKPFNITVKNDGTGYAYVTEDKNVYIVSYSSDEVNINVSYTNIGE